MKKALFLFVFVISVSCLAGQSASLLEVMQRDSAIDLFLTLDWKELHKKKKDKIYLPAHCSFVTKSGDSMAFDMKVRARGNMRLNICSYPPLKLKFDKADLENRSLKTLNELDIVNHCQSGEQYDQLILREYLAYKLYEEISPFCFKTQLVRLHYLKPDGCKADEATVGYIVENTEELVARLSAKRTKTPVISQNGIDRKSFLRVCVFQFMIGNTDWFVKNRHNLEFIGVPGIPFLVPVPFDFDYSGLVGAPYASHHESLKMTSVLTRYYQGNCEPKEDVLSILNEFHDKKESLLKIAREIPGMNERSVKYAVDYLTEFFMIIENPKKVENYILRHCGMWPVEN